MFCSVVVEVVEFVLAVCLLDLRYYSTTSIILMSLKIQKNTVKTCFRFAGFMVYIWICICADAIFKIKS